MAVASEWALASRALVSPRPAMGWQAEAVLASGRRTRTGTRTETPRLRMASRRATARAPPIGPARPRAGTAGGCRASARADWAWLVAAHRHKRPRRWQYRAG